MPTLNGEVEEVAAGSAWLATNEETDHLEPLLSDDSMRHALERWRSIDPFSRNIVVGTDAIAIARKSGSLSVWLEERPAHQNGWSARILEELGVHWEYTIFDTSVEVSG